MEQSNHLLAVQLIINSDYTSLCKPTVVEGRSHCSPVFLTARERWSVPVRLQGWGQRGLPTFHFLLELLFQSGHLLLQALDAVSVCSLSGGQRTLCVSLCGSQSVGLTLGLIPLTRRALARAVQLLHLRQLRLQQSDLSLCVLQLLLGRVE